MFTRWDRKNNVRALLEFDVTENRKKIREVRRRRAKLSFNAWLIKVISDSMKNHPDVATFRISTRKMIRFNDINISMVVEKDLGEEKVPIPMVIEKCNKKTPEEIPLEIEEPKNQLMTKDDVVLGRRVTWLESLYYRLPGFTRRWAWHYMLGHPSPELLLCVIILLCPIQQKHIFANILRR
ncbi:MAG: 2-oxo acid dehydrogenase subunit E2 [Bacteroidota bacterium]